MKWHPSFKRLYSQAFFDKLDRDRIFDLSASLSYYTALSIAPLMILLLMSVSFLGGEFKVELIQQAQDLVGGKAADTIRDIALNADRSPNIRDLAGLFGILTLLFSAGAIFGQLRTSLDTIFQSEPWAPSGEDVKFSTTVLDFLKQKVFNAGMVLTFVFISLISLIISSAISLVLKGISAVVGQTVNFVGSMFIFGLIFGCLYLYMPKRRIRKRIAFISGMITALLFSIGKSLIGLYLGQSAIASLYGAAGSFIILLMWVYYSSLIIFLGAEIAHEWNEELKTKWNKGS